MQFCYSLCIIWRGIRIMKLLIKQFSPATCYFISLGILYSKYCLFLNFLEPLTSLEYKVHLSSMKLNLSQFWGMLSVHGCKAALLLLSLS